MTEFCNSTGKECFATPQAAVELAKRLDKRSNRSRATRAYKCEHCASYHITSTDERHHGKLHVRKYKAKHLRKRR